MVEAAERLRSHRLQALHGTDWKPRRVPAGVEHARHRLSPHAFVSGLAAAQLGQHHTPLGVDVRLIEQGVASPLAQDGEAGLEDLPIAGGNR